MSAGVLLVDILGQELTPEEIEMLRHPMVGGVVLFTRNFASVAQLTALTADIKAVRADLLIATDHEGGRVQRFHDGFTTLPPMAALGALYAENPEQAIQQAEHYGFTMASELLACGVEQSFAPVLDLDKGVSRVLAGGRAISADVATVVAVAKAYMAGMQRAGMAAIAKHFPGHGSVVVDSHVGLPIDDRPLADIMADDLQPFCQLIAAGLPGIMPAHIIFSQVDSLPASLSRVWLQDILRTELGFTGTVYSDCLSMAGSVEIAADPVERVQMALNAGCDKVLLCNDGPAQLAVLAQMNQ